MRTPRLGKAVEKVCPWGRRRAGAGAQEDWPRPGRWGTKLGTEKNGGEKEIG